MERLGSSLARRYESQRQKTYPKVRFLTLRLIYLNAKLNSEKFKKKNVVFSLQAFRSTYVLLGLKFSTYILFDTSLKPERQICQEIHDISLV